MSRRRPLALLCAAAAVALGSCVQNLESDTLVPLMSLREEQEVGRIQHPRMLAAFGGAYEDAALDRYVAELTVRLIERSGSPNAIRSVTILDSPSVNAFALPGGYIYVTRGLLALASDEAELAMVIAHEVGHVEARHPAKRIARLASAEVLDSIFGRIIGGDQADQVAALGSEGYIAHYSRTQEFEADELGVGAATRAGYDPTAALSFLEAMERDQALQAKLLRKRGKGASETYMAAHPPTPARLNKARGVVAKLPEEGERVRDPYLDAIDGMIFGDAPKNGIVRGRSFYQPSLGFVFTVPAEYVIHNRPTAVVAIGEGKNLILFDSTEVAAEEGLASYIERDWGSALAVRDAVAFKANGLDAATAYAPLGHRDVRLVAIRFDAERVYRFIALGEPGTLERFAGPVAELARSFRRLAPGEAQSIKPLRIRIHTVQRGETVEGLANTMPFATDRLERFRALNNLDAGARLEPGRRIKLIVG